MPRAQPTFRTPLPQNVRDESDPLVLRATARLVLQQREAVKAYGREGDPWAFCRDAVWTRDEAVLGSGIADGPQRKLPDKAYLEHLVRLWQREKLLAIPKSRRMIVTWLFVSLFYWRARFTPGARIAFLARKEGKTEAEGSAELVNRAVFIHEHLPPTIPRIGVDHHHCYMRFENGSEILGLGAGSDQARQLTFTGVLGDEVGYWDEPLETWVGLKPTIEGGGQIVLVSSAAVGCWKDIVHDML